MQGVRQYKILLHYTCRKTQIMYLEGCRMKAIRESTSKFVKIRCPKCKNEQIVFGKTSSLVKCLVCGKVLAESTGGKSRIKARILEVLA
jgi:small subunit ribosomal protein S27e